MVPPPAGLTTNLGYKQYAVAGHDRGARVTHRMCLDHPDRVTHAAVLDIAPTLTMYERTDMSFAMGYYEWFLLPQPEPFPEKLIGSDPKFYLVHELLGWSKNKEAEIKTTISLLPIRMARIMHNGQGQTTRKQKRMYNVPNFVGVRP
jgi:haloacetate dehalogenase